MREGANMAIYTSRFSNPQLKTEHYTAIQISTGNPRWKLGYPIAASSKVLSPYGIFKKFTGQAFKDEYVKRLESIGVNAIMKELQSYEKYGNDIVLLCFEDIRDPSKTCHRTMFADWWFEKTGVKITELADPTVPRITEMPDNDGIHEAHEQMSLL